MRLAAGKPQPSDRLTFDQWNYYYADIRGVPGPRIEDIFPGTDRAYLMTAEEWKAKTGLSGLRYALWTR